MPELLYLVTMSLRACSGNEKVWQEQCKHLQSESAVLSLGFLPLQCILCPDSLGVGELRLPRLNVAVQVGNQLLLLVTHARPAIAKLDQMIFQMSDDMLIRYCQV